jgi:hypothetical protein
MAHDAVTSGMEKLAILISSDPDIAAAFVEMKSEMEAEVEAAVAKAKAKANSEAEAAVQTAAFDEAVSEIWRAEQERKQY